MEDEVEHLKRLEDLLSRLRGIVDQGRNTYKDYLDPEQPISSQLRSELFQTIEARLHLISSTVTPLTRELNTDLNTLTPLYTLPTEILLYIWSFLNIKDSLSFARVCQKTRQVALETGVCWSSIDISCWEADRIRLCMERSATVPLRLRFGERRTLGRGGRSGFFFGSLRKSIHRGAFGMDLSRQEVEGLMQRARVLDVLVAREEFCYTRTTSFSRPMPFLEALRLAKGYAPSTFGHSATGEDSEWRIPAPLAGGVCPKLTTLVIEHLDLAWGNEPALRNLTSLTITRPPNPPSPEELYSILSQSPQLASLSFLMDAHNSRPCLDENLPALMLPKLRDLLWEEGSSATMVSFLSKIYPSSVIRCDVASTDFGFLEANIPMFDLILHKADRLRLRFHGGAFTQFLCGTPQQPNLVLSARLSVYLNTAGPGQPGQEGLFGHALEQSFPWHQIKTLELSGQIPIASYVHLFSRCTHLRRLILPAGDVADEVFQTALGLYRCIGLSHLEVVSSPSMHQAIVEWVEARSDKANGCMRLNHLVIILEAPQQTSTYDPVLGTTILTPDGNGNGWTDEMEARIRVSVDRFLLIPLTPGPSAFWTHGTWSARDRRISDASDVIVDDADEIPKQNWSTIPPVFDWS